MCPAAPGSDQNQHPGAAKPRSREYRLTPYDEVARLVIGNETANAANLVEWLQSLSALLHIDPLSVYGITTGDLPLIADKSAITSSMKDNPLTLTKDELLEILEQAL